MKNFVNLNLKLRISNTNILITEKSYWISHESI